MKNLICFILVSILLGNITFAQSYNQVTGKQDFKDSIKLTKYGNNGAGDSVLTVDPVTKKLKFVKRGATISNVDSIINNYLGITNSTTRLITGSVYKDTLMNFIVTDLTYLILGKYYTSTATTFTFNPADEFLDRYSIVVVDTLGNIIIRDGVAAIPAQIPTATQYELLLGTYFIPATASTTGAISTDTTGYFDGAHLSVTGDSIIHTNHDNVVNIVKLRPKYLEAGTNITITEDGLDTLIVSSTGGGATLDDTMYFFRYVLYDSVMVFKNTSGDSVTVVIRGSGSGGGSGTVTDVAALTLGTSGTDLNSTVANGTTTPVITLNVPDASALNRGALTASDWTLFNAKQAAGNYITALTGDGTASGPGSAALTLATVNSNVGSFTNANITVNAKGLVTAVSNGSGGGGTSTIDETVNAAGDGQTDFIFTTIPTRYLVFLNGHAYTNFSVAGTTITVGMSDILTGDKLRVFETQ